MKTKCIKSLDSESSTWLATQIQSIKLFPREKERNPRSYTRVQEREFSCQWIKEVVEKAWTVPSKHQYVKSNPHPESQRERHTENEDYFFLFFWNFKGRWNVSISNWKTAIIFMNPAFLHPKSWDPRSPKTQRPEKKELFQFHRERERESVWKRSEMSDICVEESSLCRKVEREREREREERQQWSVIDSTTKIKGGIKMTSLI